MKVFYNKDDMYPMFYLDLTDAYYGREADIPEDLFNRYQEALGNFQTVLEELKEVIGKGN